jgi:hypothetical protein
LNVATGFGALFVAIFITYAIMGNLAVEQDQRLEDGMSSQDGSSGSGGDQSGGGSQSGRQDAQPNATPPPDPPSVADSTDTTQRDPGLLRPSVADDTETVALSEEPPVRS